MNARLRGRLRAGIRHLVPAVIKDYKYRFDMMTIGYGQVTAYPLFEAGCILLPGYAMQVYPHGIKTNLLRPAQLPADGSRIESSGLPHLQLVDSGAGKKIRS